MRVKNHKVEGLTFHPAHYTGETITPDIVILHDTAGRLEKGNTAAYLASANTAKASVHFVIEIDGTIVQQVPTNRRANHAGQSSWQGRSGCNVFSIGIELVNPGKMSRVDGQWARAWWGEQFNAFAFDIYEVETPEHGHGLWMQHPAAQITALIDLLEVLFRDIASLQDITTHWYVSPGRKVDPNPLLPLTAIRSHILGQDDPADVVSLGQSVPSGAEEMVAIDIDPMNGHTLNLRRWPSFNPNVIAEIPDGAIVPVFRRGTFDGREWLRVLYGGKEGWIVSRYTAAAIHSSEVSR